jgi:hypothetical protein
MEHRRFGAVIGCAVALRLVLAPAPASTHEGAHEEGAHATGTSHADTKTVGELWRGVKVHETELQRLVQAKDLGKVHEVAFALRDLVAAMPDQSAQLPPERLAKLQGNVKYVGTLAERLDAAGDANDQAATERSIKQLDSVLAAIAALYPEGAPK